MRLIAAILSIIAVPALAVAPSRTSPPYRDGELLVKYAAGATAKSMDLQRRGFTVKRRLLGGEIELLVLPAITTVPQAVALLSADPGVELAEPNYLSRPLAVIPNDPLFPQQWGLRNTGQPNFFPGGPAGIPGADMNLTTAWDSDGDGVADRVGVPSVIVAVIDDGIETSHPDLSPNLLPGRDTRDDDNNPNPSTGERHGTLVTGAVGARGNNGFGVAGVVWNARILPIRFGFDKASELEALEFARANGASIINASFGGPGFSEMEQAAIRGLIDDDILVVAAAGNDDANLDRAEFSYPANLDAANVLAVAMTNRQDGVASFSTYGPVSVDVAAPGLQIVTTDTGGTYTVPDNCGGSGGSCGVSGTSFAAPYAAGVAALIRSSFPAVTFREIKARLIEGADPGLDPGNPARLRVAGGRINAQRSLGLGARPALVIRTVTLVDDGNRRLDPGETLNIDLVVENLWQAATGVSATLTGGGVVTVNTGAVALGAVASGGTATARFSVTVPVATQPYRDVFLTLNLAADGGYAASRSFALEIAELQPGVQVSPTLGNSIYDEFQTFHLDVASVPAGMNQLEFTTTSSPDIDILVKRGAPARYQITLDAQQGDEDAVFFTDVPAEQIGGGADGNERVVIANPQPGTYYVTVVNYNQVPANPYTLRAAFSQASFGGGGGGGGALPLPLLLGLLLVLGLRRRK